MGKLPTYFFIQEFFVSLFLLYLHMKEEKIVCASIYFKDGKEHPHQPRNIKTGIVISGLRHCNCFATAGVIKLKQEHEYSQGFITTDHVYVDRYMAFKIAKANGQFLDDPQVPHDISHQQLFSEDLY